ncbi:MBL fold metallo-hydrolase [Paenibacillus sp. 102]
MILTHGNFEHIRAVIELIKKWDVNVYTHELELLYLTGKMRYQKIHL